MMRITNSIITANTKANINVNKVNADTLNTMTASGQKITRPSDDPVVAIRAMRLNTNLTELGQYYGKNIPDADAWFTDTEAALSQADVILENMREKLNQASSQENQTTNVLDILEELEQLSAQFYAIGNADCAGRTVFTGFRTSEMLTFTEPDKIQYQIQENISFDKCVEASYVKGTRPIDVSGDNITTYSGYNQEAVTQEKIHKFNLAYGNLMEGSNFDIAIKDKNGSTIGSASGTVVSISGMSQSDIDDLYARATGDVVVIKETGEVIMPEDTYNSAVAAKAASIDIAYAKNEWQKGDPRPEHYFMCMTPATTDPRTYSDTYPEGIEYNYNRVDASGNPVVGNTAADKAATKGIKGFVEQDLTYEIAFNQTLQINSHASETFIHDIGRDISELVRITQAVQTTEKNVASVQEAFDKEEDIETKAKYETLLAAVKKENDLMKDKMHDMFTGAITSFKEYADIMNKEISRVGALTSRLELTKNRVKDQQTNVKKLADANINADLTETALDYKNAQLALEAAQMAAGKIAKQTLLNYI